MHGLVCQPSFYCAEFVPTRKQKPAGMCSYYILICTSNRCFHDVVVFAFRSNYISNTSIPVSVRSEQRLCRCICIVLNATTCDYCFITVLIITAPVYLCNSTLQFIYPQLVVNVDIYQLNALVFCEVGKTKEGVHHSHSG